MKWRVFLERAGLSSLKIKTKYLEAEFKPKNPDKEAAWELYIELLTRITTQTLLPEAGDEKAALDSLYALFPITREILRCRGPGCVQFARLAIPVLNQIIRPFTSKWHKLSMQGGFGKEEMRETFRDELTALQQYIRAYATSLARLAGVEDITDLETYE